MIPPEAYRVNPKKIAFNFVSEGRMFLAVESDFIPKFVPYLYIRLSQEDKILLHWRDDPVLQKAFNVHMTQYKMGLI